MELTGSGYCSGSFGELLQGVLPGNKKFLVNLKIKRRSQARVSLMSSTYSNKKEAQFADSYRSYSKSYKVVRNILVDIGRHDDCFLEIVSDIPVGKGCSSSTADMVACIQSLATALSLALKPEYIGRMLTEIEPNDGLHYQGTSIYQHTTGELIARFDYVPPLRILGIDFGGMIDSVEFNKKKISWSDAELEKYATLLEEAKGALRDEDISSLCRIATESALLWQKVNPKDQLDNVMQFMSDSGGLGVVNAHSGTCLGILYRDDRGDLSEMLRSAKAEIPSCDIHLFETVSCVTAPEKSENL